MTLLANRAYHAELNRAYETAIRIAERAINGYGSVAGLGGWGPGTP